MLVLAPPKPDPTAQLDESVDVASMARIDAHTVIGANTLVASLASIGNNCRLGERWSVKNGKQI